MDDVARLLAYEEIRQLAARYAVAIDRRDLDALVALFIDDVRVGRDTYGRDALRANFEESLGGHRPVGPEHRAPIRSTSSTTTTPPDMCTAKGEIADGDRWIHQAIRYDDTYERRNGHWYFVRRLHKLFYGAEVGVNPLELPPANWPENPDGLGTLPYEEPTWQAFNDR